MRSNGETHDTASKETGTLYLTVRGDRATLRNKSARRKAAQVDPCWPPRDLGDHTGLSDSRD